MDVAYTSSPANTARSMVARSMSSNGKRRAMYPKYYPDVIAGAYAPAFDPRGGLAGLGLTGSQAGTGVKTGVSAGATATAIGAGVASAVGAGAAAGSVVPIIGTAIGAIVGLVASGIFNRKDPEAQNFDQAVAMWNQNRTSVLNIADKYLVLAGLFDLSKVGGNIPIYKKYGRMGEQRFVTDMMTRIYQAAQAGQITVNDTPQTIMSRIVQPWIDSWGYGPMVDAHADLINLILLGMTAEYVGGNETTWVARGGDYPFSSLPKFPLQQIIAAAQPKPVVTLPPPVMAPAPFLTLPTPALPAPSPPPPLPTPAPPQLQPTPLPPQQTLPAIPQLKPLPANPQAQFPGGFAVVGTDTNGNPVYANAQGVLYTWTGTQMMAFTGQLAANSNQMAQIQAAIQAALAQGQSQQQAAQTGLTAAQAQGVPVTPALQTQVADQAAVTASAPQTAGVGGVSGWMGALVAAGTVAALLFATARPARS